MLLRGEIHCTYHTLSVFETVGSLLIINMQWTRERGNVLLVGYLACLTNLEMRMDVAVTWGSSEPRRLGVEQHNLTAFGIPCPNKFKSHQGQLVQ